MTRVRGLPASMGPRLFNRGKVSPPGTTTQDCVASMGPRLFNRGKWGKSKYCAGTETRLQWGRGYSTAESRTTSTTSDRGGTLQWGRGYSTAESTCDCIDGLNDTHCFNGAAVIQPRKGFRAGHDRQKGRSLQWGRGYSTAESFGDDGVSAPSGDSFNGAAVIQPRKGRRLGRIAFD